MAFLLAAVLVLLPYVGQAQLSAGRLDPGRKVSKITHADGVRNHVKEGDVADSGLQASLSEKLTYDRIGCGVMFNALNRHVQNGVATVGGDGGDYLSRDLICCQYPS